MFRRLVGRTNPQGGLEAKLFAGFGDFVAMLQIGFGAHEDDNKGGHLGFLS